MICPVCADNGKPVDMDHVEGESTYHDPGAHDGVGFQATCGYVCPVCGREEECDGDHGGNDTDDDS